MIVPGAAAPRWNWLLASFARREIVNRYSGSVSGLAWTLLHPLLLLAIYSFLFREVFRVRVPEGYGGASATAFIAVALWPWIMFSESVTRAMASIAGNADLIRKVAFPHTLLVYSAVLAGCAVHGLGFLVVLGALAATGEPLRLASIPLVLVLIVPYMLLAAGLGALLAALQTLLRDVEHAVQVLLVMLFYATPILYPVQLLPERLQPWLAANPLAWFSERLRAVLLEGGGLVAGDLVAALACLAVFLGGRWVFLRLSPHFEDFL